MNLDLVEQLVTLVSEYPVSEIEVVSEGRRIAVRRPLVASAAPAPAADLAAAAPPAPALLEEASLVEEVWTLTAPMVGIFHHAAPVSPAAVLRAAQVVGSIESMKLMNDVVT